MILVKKKVYMIVDNFRVHNVNLDGRVQRQNSYISLTSSLLGKRMIEAFINPIIPNYAIEDIKKCLCLCLGLIEKNLSLLLVGVIFLR